MSGEELRVRIDLGFSIVTVVRRGGAAPSRVSTSSSQSPSITRSFKLKRVGVALRVAPRALIDSMGMARECALPVNKSRTDYCRAPGLAVLTGTSNDESPSI